MSMVSRIQTLVKEKGSNLKQLEVECGIGNGTIRRWDEQSPRLDKIMKVAENLNVSLDYLVYGVPEPNTSPAASQYTKMEVDLVSMLRLLPKEHQRELFDYTYFKYKRLVEKSEESIYSTYSDARGNKKSGHTQDRIQDATA